MRNRCIGPITDGLLSRRNSAFNPCLAVNRCLVVDGERRVNGRAFTCPIAHGHVNTLQWVIDAYNVVYASLLLTAGTLADLYGRRKIFVLGTTMLAAGSLVCRLAPNAAMLIAGRAIAGLGAALEVPTSLAILSVAYPDPKRRTHALGFWASCNGLAFVIGPTLGGVLVDAVGWRSIFLLVLPLCAAALALTMTSVPESKDPNECRLDLPGQAIDCRARRIVACSHRRTALGLVVERQRRLLRNRN
jgi:MFS family permease